MALPVVDAAGCVAEQVAAEGSGGSGSISHCVAPALYPTQVSDLPYTVSARHSMQYKQNGQCIYFNEIFPWTPISKWHVVRGYHIQINAVQFICYFIPMRKRGTGEPDTFS